MNRIVVLKGGKRNGYRIRGRVCEYGRLGPVAASVNEGGVA
jgi:hypothetical protein